MKNYQIYNAAIDDVLDVFDKWWKDQECTSVLVDRIKKLRCSQKTSSKSEVDNG